MCHEIFDLHFFHDSNPTRSLISRLKYFRIWFQFCRDIQILKKLHSVHPTAESYSAVCIIPRSQAQRCASHRGVKLGCVHHRGVKLSGVNPTAESDFAVCIKPLSRAPRCASYRRVWLRGVHPTAESVLTKCLFWFKVLQMQFLSVAWRYYVKWKLYCKSKIV